MKNILIKNVRVLSSNGLSNNKDIIIQNGKLIDNDDISNFETIINGEGMVVFPSLIDVGTNLSEPGYEHRENLEQTCKAALLGGYGTLLVFPNTLPVLDSKTNVQNLHSRSNSFSNINLYAIGAVSKNLSGEELSEILDMRAGGIIAISDGHKPIKSSGLLLRAMDYIKSFNGIVITTPYDKNLFPHGQMHEGKISTLLGLPGIPEISEDVIVNRDIELAKFTGSKLHLNCVSTPKSVELIRKAKSEGYPITCSVSINNLIFTDDDLINYNSNLKLCPPVRTDDTRNILWENVKNGTIDIIVSQHTPLEKELKDLEFTYADFGALGLQTTLLALLTKYGEEHDIWNIVFKTMYQNPKVIFNLDIEESYRVVAETAYKKISAADLSSNCTNSPFIGKELKYEIIEL